MLIVSLATHEIGNGKNKLWILLVTYYNYGTGEGVVVPMAFDTPEDRDDSFELMKRVAELQGGEQADLSSPFSEN